jgi:hypothetical protein
VKLRCSSSGSIFWTVLVFPCRKVIHLNRVRLEITQDGQPQGDCNGSADIGCPFHKPQQKLLLTSGTSHCSLHQRKLLSPSILSNEYFVETAFVLDGGGAPEIFEDMKQRWVSRASFNRSKLTVRSTRRW